MKTTFNFSTPALHWKSIARFFAMLALTLCTVTRAWADATDNAAARDAARRADEEWRKLVYGDPTKPAPPAPIITYYAAIAYSEKTGQWGFSNEYKSLKEAGERALKECKSEDAKIVTWSSDGWWCALAKGTGGAFGFGSGPTAKKARDMALEECSKRAKECEVVACVRASP